MKWLTVLLLLASSTTLLAKEPLPPWQLTKPTPQTLPQQEKSQPALKSIHRQVLFFTASWCQPCRTHQAPQLQRLKSSGWVQTPYQNATKTDQILTVDIDLYPELKAKYDVKLLPSFVLLADGLPVDGITGIRTAEEIAGLYNDYDPTPKTGALDSNMVDKILEKLKKPGRLVFSPDDLITIPLDDKNIVMLTGVNCTYMRKGGKFEITYSQPLPRFKTKIGFWWAEGSITTTTYDPATHSVYVQNSLKNATISIKFDK